MDDTTRGTRRPEGDSPQSPSPPNITSKSTSISQSESQSSPSHRAATVPALQARPSYAAIAKNVEHRLDIAEGASPGATSRRRELRPTVYQTTGQSAAASRGHQATTEQFDVEPYVRSRAGKVSTPVHSVILQLVIGDPHQWPSVTVSSRCRQHTKRFHA